MDTANQENDESSEGTSAPTDPKEQMRLALERKHSKEKVGQAHTDSQAKAGQASGRAGGAKMFRRKSGG